MLTDRYSLCYSLKFLDKKRRCESITQHSRPGRYIRPRSQRFFPGLGAGREKAMASAGHVLTLHPEILGVIN